MQRYLNEYSRCEKYDEIISFQNTSLSQQTEVPKQQAPLNVICIFRPSVCGTYNNHMKNLTMNLFPFFVFTC